MTNFILLILSLFQLTISAAAFGIGSNESIEITYVSDSEIIYDVIDNEQSQLWHWDVLTSTGTLLTVAKPYLKGSILSYKKIEDVEIYTIENDVSKSCELWVYYEGNTSLASENSLCDINAVSLYDNKLYIPLKPISPLTPEEWESTALISYNLSSHQITVEFDRAELDVLDPFASHMITDIKHFSHYTFVTLTDGFFSDISRIIKLDKNHQEIPVLLLITPDGTEAGVKVLTSDKLHIVTYKGYSTNYIDVYRWNEELNQLEQIIELVEHDYAFTHFFNYKDELHAVSRGGDANSLLRVLDDGSMINLGELQGNMQGLYTSNEQIFYTTADSPFGYAYKINDDYSSEFLFELISYNRSLVVADNLMFFFGNENNIGIYNQEEQSFDLVTLTSQVESPEISGLPSSMVNANESYEFIPEIYDPLGIPLELTIENKPNWAVFDSLTGAIKGNPVDVAQYDNIIITVSNGYLEATLPAFSIQVLKAKSNEQPKSSGGANSYLLFILCISYLMRIFFKTNCLKAG